MVSAISVRVMPFFFADWRWNTSELSVMPWLIREVMVTKLRSRKPSLSVRFHISPKRTSSLSSANLEANSPNWVRPAVCIIFSCAIILSVKILNTEIKRILFILVLRVKTLKIVFTMICFLFIYLTFGKWICPISIVFLYFPRRGTDCLNFEKLAKRTRLIHFLIANLLRLNKPACIWITDIHTRILDFAIKSYVIQFKWITFAQKK